MGSLQLAVAAPPQPEGRPALRFEESQARWDEFGAAEMASLWQEVLQNGQEAVPGPQVSRLWAAKRWVVERSVAKRSASGVRWAQLELL